MGKATHAGKSRSDLGPWKTPGMTPGCLIWAPKAAQRRYLWMQDGLGDGARAAAPCSCRNRDSEWPHLQSVFAAHRQSRIGIDWPPASGGPNLCLTIRWNGWEEASGSTEQRLLRSSSRLLPGTTMAHAAHITTCPSQPARPLCRCSARDCRHWQGAVRRRKVCTTIASHPRWRWWKKLQHQSRPVGQHGPAPPNH